MPKSKYQKYLPIGIAVFAGGLLLYYSTRAKADPKKPVDPIGPGPVVDPPAPKGSKKKDAPPFPHSLGEAKNFEFAQTNAEHGEWLAFLGSIMEGNDNPGPDPSDEDYAEARSRLQIPKWRTIPGVLTDEAFDVIYGKSLSIPDKKDRGSGWQPYLDSWVRMQDYLKTQTWVGG